MAPLSDELLDELDELMLRMGKIMTARHAAHTPPGPCGHSLSATQALLARTLAGHGPAKVGELATLLGVKPPAASAMIDSLEREGLVERTTDPEDRRSTYVRLTKPGVAALETAEQTRRELLRRYLNVLDEQDVVTLVRIHRTLIDAMDEGRI